MIDCIMIIILFHNYNNHTLKFVLCHLCSNHCSMHEAANFIIIYMYIGLNFSIYFDNECIEILYQHRFNWEMSLHSQVTVEPQIAISITTHSVLDSNSTA